MTPTSPASTRRQSMASATSLQTTSPSPTRRQSTSAVASLPSASSSTTLVGNTSPTTIPFKPTPNTPIPSTSCRSLQDLTSTSLHTRIKRQLTKLAHLRPPLPAPILSTTLAFILLHDINGTTTCPATGTGTPLTAVSDTRWCKLWIPSTGQRAQHLASSGVNGSHSTNCSDLCALASDTRASTLVATLKHWLLAGCTRRWPKGEPLVPLDVIACVHARLHKYGACAEVQRAVEKRLARTQAADFALVAAHVRNVVGMWPGKASEVVDEWAPVVTRVEEQVGRVVRGGVRDEEKVRVRNMCWEVFWAVVVDVRGQNQGPVSLFSTPGPGFE